MFPWNTVDITRTKREAIGSHEAAYSLDKAPYRVGGVMAKSFMFTLLLPR